MLLWHSIEPGVGPTQLAVGGLSSSSSGIAAVYDSGGRSPLANDRHSSDAPSTSYPTNRTDDWDALGACMTTASEMEACVDAVVRSSVQPGHSHQQIPRYQTLVTEVAI